ncbi:hypothetical protein BB561_001541 [Smittium simulii]|uniref:FMP27 GFWDK domain-containing protein n=1 Tax=Smittium simulii TaxID=133385 RepID=A0A2T9YU44_9FUNG|nr:hypothetical protein BB561_001541 [Smittium simulii]
MNHITVNEIVEDTKSLLDNKNHSIRTVLNNENKAIDKETSTSKENELEESLSVLLAKSGYIQEVLKNVKGQELMINKIEKEIEKISESSHDISADKNLDLKNGLCINVQIDAIKLRFNILYGLLRLANDWNPFSAKNKIPTSQNQNIPEDTKNSKKESRQTKDETTKTPSNRLVELQIIKPKFFIFSTNENINKESKQFKETNHSQFENTEILGNNSSSSSAELNTDIKNELKNLEKRAKNIVNKISSILTLTANIGSLFFPNFAFTIEQMDFILSKNQQSYKLGHAITLQFSQITAESVSLGKSSRAFWLYELFKYIFKFIKTKLFSSSQSNLEKEDIPSDNNRNTQSAPKRNKNTIFNEGGNVSLGEADSHWYSSFFLNSEIQTENNPSSGASSGTYTTGDIFYTYKVKVELQPVKAFYMSEISQDDQSKLSYTESNQATNMFRGFGLLKKAKKTSINQSTNTGLEIFSGSYIDLDLSSNIWGSPNHAKAKVFFNSLKTKSNHIHMMISEAKKILSYSNSNSSSALDLDFYLEKIKQKLFESAQSNISDINSNFDNESTSENQNTFSDIESRFNLVLNDIYTEIYSKKHKQLALYYLGYLLKLLSLKSLSIELAFKEIIFEFVSDDLADNQSNAKSILIVQKNVTLSCEYNTKSNIYTHSHLNSENDQFKKFSKVDSGLCSMSDKTDDYITNYFLLFPEFPRKPFALDACVALSVDFGEFNASLVNQKSTLDYFKKHDGFNKDTRISINSIKFAMVLPIKFYTLEGLRFATYAQTNVHVNNPMAVIDLEFFITFLKAIKQVSLAEKIIGTNNLDELNKTYTAKHYSQVLNSILSEELQSVKMNKNILFDQSIEIAKKYAHKLFWAKMAFQNFTANFRLQKIKLALVPQTLLSTNKSDLNENSLIFLYNESIELNIQRTFPSIEHNYKNIATMNILSDINFSILPISISYVENYKNSTQFFDNKENLKSVQLFNLEKSSITGKIDVLFGWPDNFLSENNPHFNFDLFFNIGSITSEFIGDSFLETLRHFPLWMWVKTLIKDFQFSDLHKNTTNSSKKVNFQQNFNYPDNSHTGTKTNITNELNNPKPITFYNYKIEIALSSVNMRFGVFDGELDKDNLMAHGFVVKMTGLNSKINFKPFFGDQKKLKSNIEIQKFVVLTSDFLYKDKLDFNSDFKPGVIWDPYNLDKYIELNSLTIDISSVKKKNEKKVVTIIDSKVQLLNVVVSIANFYRLFLVFHQIEIIKNLSSGDSVFRKHANINSNKDLLMVTSNVFLNLEFSNVLIDYLIPVIDIHMGDTKYIYQESQRKHILVKSRQSNIKLDLSYTKEQTQSSMELKCTIPTLSALGFSKASQPLFIFTNTRILINKFTGTSSSDQDNMKTQFIFDEGCINIPNNLRMSDFIDGIVLLIKCHKTLSKKNKADKIDAIKKTSINTKHFVNLIKSKTAIDDIIQILLKEARIDIPDLRGDIIKSNKYIKKLSTPDIVPPIYIHGKIFALIVEDDPFETALSRIYQVGKKEQVARLARMDALEKKASKIPNPIFKADVKPDAKSSLKPKVELKKSKTSEIIHENLNTSAEPYTEFDSAKKLNKTRTTLKDYEIENFKEPKTTTPAYSHKYNNSTSKYSSKTNFSGSNKTALNVSNKITMSAKSQRVETEQTKKEKISDNNSMNKKYPLPSNIDNSSTASNQKHKNSLNMIEKALEKLYEFESSNWIKTIRKFMINKLDKKTTEHGELSAFEDSKILKSNTFPKKFASAERIESTDVKHRSKNSEFLKAEQYPNINDSKELNSYSFNEKGLNLDLNKNITHSISDSNIIRNSLGASHNFDINNSIESFCGIKEKNFCLPVYNNSNNNWSFPIVPLFCLTLTPIRLKIETPNELMNFDDIIRYMREIDPSVPENQEWSTLAPLRIKMKAGELRVQMRDLPVPLVYFPDPFRLKDPAEIADRHKKAFKDFIGGVSVEGGFIISEQRAKDEAVRFCSIPMSTIKIDKMDENIELMTKTGQYDSKLESFIMRLPILKTLTFPRVHTNFSVIIYNSATLDAKKAIEYYQKGQFEKISDLGITFNEFNKILSLGRLPTPSPIICWAQRVQPILTEISQRFESITSSTVEPSPPMAWWNKIRARVRVKCRFACTDISLKELTNTHSLDSNIAPNINTSLSSLQTSELLFYSPSGRDPYDYSLENAGYLFSFRGCVRFTIGEEDEYDTGMYESFKKPHQINIGNAYGGKPVTTPPLSEILRVRCMKFNCWVPNIDSQQVNAFNIMLNGIDVVRKSLTNKNENVYNLDQSFLMLFNIIKLVPKFPYLNLGSVSNLTKEPFIKILADLTNGVRLSLGFGYSIAYNDKNLTNNSPNKANFIDKNKLGDALIEEKEVTTWDVLPHAPENVPLELLECYDTYKNFRSYGTHFGISILSPYQTDENYTDISENGRHMASFECASTNSAASSYPGSVDSLSKESLTDLPKYANSDTSSNSNSNLNHNYQKKLTSNKYNRNSNFNFKKVRSQEILDFSPSENDDFISTIASNETNQIKIDSNFDTSELEHSQAKFPQLLKPKYKPELKKQASLSVFHAISPLHNVNYRGDIVACDSFISAISASYINECINFNESSDCDSTNKCKLNISAVSTSIFMNYIKSFSSRLMLPIKKGKLYPESEKKDNKFGRSLLSLSLGVNLADMQIAYSHQLSEIKELESQELKNYFDFEGDTPNLSEIIDRFTSMQKNLNSKNTALDETSKPLGIDNIAPAKTEDNNTKKKKEMSLRWVVQDMDAEIDDFDVRIVKMKFMLPLFLKFFPAKINELVNEEKINMYRGLAILGDSYKYLEKVPEKLKWLDSDSMFDLGSFSLTNAIFSEIDVMCLLWAPRLIYFTQSTEPLEDSGYDNISKDASYNNSFYSNQNEKIDYGSDSNQSNYSYTNKSPGINSFDKDHDYSSNNELIAKKKILSKKSFRNNVTYSPSAKINNRPLTTEGSSAFKYKQNISSIIDHRKVLRDTHLAMSMLLNRRKERLGYIINLKRRRYLERINDFELGLGSSVNDIHRELIKNFDEVFELSGRRRLINQCLNMLGCDQSQNIYDNSSHLQSISKENLNKKEDSSKFNDSIEEERVYRHRFLLHSAYLVWNSKLRDSLFKFFFNEDKIRAIEYFISQQALHVVKSLNSTHKNNPQTTLSQKSISSSADVNSKDNDINFIFSSQNDINNINSSDVLNSKFNNSKNSLRNSLNNIHSKVVTNNFSSVDEFGENFIKSRDNNRKTIPLKEARSLDSFLVDSEDIGNKKVIPYCQALIELLNSQVSLMVDETSDSSVVATFATGQISIIKMCSNSDTITQIDSPDLMPSTDPIYLSLNNKFMEKSMEFEMNTASNPNIRVNASSSKSVFHLGDTETNINSQSLAGNEENFVKTRMIVSVKNMQVFIVKREDFVDCPLYLMDCFYGANVDTSKIFSTLWPVWIPIEIILNSDDSDLETLKYTNQYNKNPNSHSSKINANYRESNSHKSKTAWNRQKYNKIIERTSGIAVFDKPNTQCINFDNNYYNDLKVLSKNQDLELLFGDNALEKLKEYLISGNSNIMLDQDNTKQRNDSDWLESNMESKIFNSETSNKEQAESSEAKDYNFNLSPNTQNSKQRFSHESEQEIAGYDESKAAFILVRVSQISIVCTSEQYLSIMNLISRLLMYNEPERALYLDELNSIRLTTDLSNISNAAPVVCQIQNSLRIRRNMMQSWQMIQWGYNDLARIENSAELLSNDIGYENMIFPNVSSKKNYFDKSNWLQHKSQYTNYSVTDFKTCARQGSSILQLSYQIKALEHQLRITMDLVSSIKRKNSHLNINSSDHLSDKHSIISQNLKNTYYNSHNRSFSLPNNSLKTSFMTESIASIDKSYFKEEIISKIDNATLYGLEKNEQYITENKKKFWGKLKGSSKNTTSNKNEESVDTVASDAKLKSDSINSIKKEKSENKDMDFNSQNKFINNTDMTKRSSVAQKVSVYVSSLNLRMLDSDGASLCDLKTKNLYSSITTSTSQAIDVMVEIDLLIALNRTENALFPHIIVPYVSNTNSNFDFSKNKMITVYYSESPPVGGIGIVELLEIDLKPIRLMLSHDIGKKLLNYFFPPPDIQLQESISSGSLNRKQDDKQKDDLSVILPKTKPRRFRVFLDKKSDSSLNQPAATDTSSNNLRSVSPSNLNDPNTEYSKSNNAGLSGKNKIEKSTQNDMKTRASKNKTFMIINIPERDHLISYRGPKKFNVTDLSDFVFHSPNLQFRNEVLSYYELMMKLKRAFINAALQHTGALVKEKFKQLRNKGISSSKDLKDSFAEALVQKIDEADNYARKNYNNLTALNKNNQSNTDNDIQQEQNSNRELLQNLIPTSLFTPFVMSSSGNQNVDPIGNRKIKNHPESSEYNNLLGTLGKYNINKLNPFYSRNTSSRRSNDMKIIISQNKDSTNKNLEISEDESVNIYKKYLPNKKSFAYLSGNDTKGSPKNKKDIFGFKNTQEDKNITDSKEPQSD